ncbi:L-rhamnose mutarotase [Microbacterium sp. SLBN-111]|uniref:L-rhamnose mutarotase n=1 Tax=Microbacterium sp. SLBN-111 TaxID=3377733 RepID=UPI003C71FF34
MLRVGMICRMVPEKREEYLALHRAVWPGVEQTLREGNIRNFTIFVRGDVLFGSYEYVGDDLAADDAKMAADPVTQEWWALTGPCQVPFDDDGSEPNWQIMTEAWHLD